MPTCSSYWCMFCLVRRVWDGGLGHVSCEVTEPCDIERAGTGRNVTYGINGSAATAGTVPIRCILLDCSRPPSSAYYSISLHHASPIVPAIVEVLMFLVRYMTPGETL